ncbi:MAG: NUDIX domain-containing protein [Clostridia bacterium]|nr:NUDIX domain-containing protein [Clostridia bacterium]
MKPTTVFAIGRWMPIHSGHKNFLVKLARTYDRLVIGIGSCYENGTPRNCIPAIEREKLLHRILKTEGITNAIIIPIEDRETFEDWIADVCRVCQMYQVTHFCTGNKEDILDVMAQKGIHLDVEMINPEEDTTFPYHATDIRNAILNNEWDKLDTMIPAEIKPMVLDQISREIKRAARGEGQAFIPGRQTVDLIFIITDPHNQKTYVLIGKRTMDKIDFPGVHAIPGGAIHEFESPIDAAVRCFRNESGIEITVLDNACEPAKARLNIPGNPLTDLYFTGIYASPDESINGTRGGGSQCFAVHLSANPDALTPLLHPIKDLEELQFIPIDTLHTMTLAYDQKRMLYDALNQLGIAFDNGELLEVYDENHMPSHCSVSRTQAHRDGILHGASHIYIYKWVGDELWFLLQRRSPGKDSFPLCLDMSSGGHIEYGSDFLKTAQKELEEELGITVDESALSELFRQTIEYTGVFHGKPFLDREINAVYALPLDPDIAKLSLQSLEVSEVVWLPSQEILTRLEENDPEICINKEEFKKVSTMILQTKA